MVSVCLITLGCPKNQVDSEIMLGLIDDADFEIIDELEDADVVVINTCGFIESAKEEAIDTILSAAQFKKSGKLKLLVVTGCLAQRYKEELLQEIPEIDALLGTGNFHRIVEIIEDGLRGVKGGEFNETGFYYHKDYRRYLTTPSYTAYVKIAEGCNNHCSYCVIPAIRGPLKSRPIEDIVEEVKSLAERGVKEIILVAQDTTVYGVDLYGQPELTELLKDLVQIEGIKWIRIMYSYPDHITDDLIEIMAAEKKICKYLDLPLQHASDKILKLMNRPTRKEHVKALIKKLREKIPGIALRTSLIVGFPGETEEDFNELLDFVKEVSFDRLGVFTYSREENTPADKLDGHVSDDVKEERWNEVMALQKEIALGKNEALIDKTVEVLVEEVYSEEEGIILGRTQWDAPEIDNLIYVYNCHAGVGDFVKVKIIDAMEYDLVGVEIK